MIKLPVIFKYLLVLISGCLLSACLGGTVAQQIVRSIATSIVDKQIARAMDVDEDQLVSNRKPTYVNKSANGQQYIEPKSTIIQPYQPASIGDVAQANSFDHLRSYNLAKQSLLNNQLDPIKKTMANSAFKEVVPVAIKPADLENTEFETTEIEATGIETSASKIIFDPLPQYSPDNFDSIKGIKTSQLVLVELVNLLIGEEKNAVYEQARLLGALGLPHQREWKNWLVASGVIQPNKKTIIFLIPPQFGKLPAGSLAMVELATAGELNVVRYKAQ